MGKTKVILFICLAALLTASAVSAKNIEFRENFLKEMPDGTIHRSPGIQFINENNTVEFHHCNYLKRNVYVCDGYIIANRGYIIMQTTDIDTMLESSNPGIVANGMVWKQVLEKQRPILLPWGGTNE